MITNPAPKPMPVVTVATDSGNLVVPCEPINEYLAITPAFCMDQDGNGLLDGGFAITHTPTGAAITDGTGCIECARAAGKRLAALDWSAVTQDNTEEWAGRLSDEDRQTLLHYRALEWGCDAEYCEPDSTS